MKLYAYTLGFHSETGAAMHLALAENGSPIALNDGFGVLFPKADFALDAWEGQSRGLINPWVFRRNGGGFGVLALRRLLPGEGRAACEPKASHCALLFQSEDLLHYQELGLVAIASEGNTLEDIRCAWDGETYRVQALYGGVWHAFRSDDLARFAEEGQPESVALRETIAVWDANPACALTVTEEEARRLRMRLCKPEYPKGARVSPFPLMPARGDPMALRYGDGYLFMATDDEHGQLALKIRSVRHINEIATADDHTLFTAASEGDMSGSLWAPELHWVGDRLCIYFAAGKPHWYTVQCHVMWLTGDDPTSAACWSAPRRMEKADGSPLCDDGITLDMTVIPTRKGDYVIWSQRPIRTDPLRCGTADLMIARLDHAHPWRLETEPVTLSRPEFGWERINSPVNEGPFLLRHGDALYVTYAAALIDHTYCVGMLIARDGDDLTDPSVWQKNNYPVVHRYSMPGRIGAGHNSFVKDEDGADVLLIHAIPLQNYLHDPHDLRRYPCIGAVEWDEDHFPHLLG